MKYYIGEIATFIGERRLDTTIRFETDGDPDDYLDKLASMFWGEDGGTQDGGYWDFGDVSTAAGMLREVSKEVYDGVDPIIVQLEVPDADATA
jgi:hypothetical protein